MTATKHPSDDELKAQFWGAVDRLEVVLDVRFDRNPIVEHFDEEPDGQSGYASRANPPDRSTH